MNRIIEKTAIAESIQRFVIEAPQVARKRRAGHFVIVRASETAERIPLTIVDSDVERGTITLIVQGVGKTTRMLNAMRAGDALADVIGPLVMMRASAQTTASYKVKTHVSLNPVMVDGTGMCGGCRVTVAGQTRFACVDGPEFDGHEVDFDNLIMRNRAYQEQERASLERYGAALTAAAEGLV